MTLPSRLTASFAGMLATGLATSAASPRSASAETPKPPGTLEDTPKPPGTLEDTPKPPGTLGDTPKPPEPADETNVVLAPSKVPPPVGNPFIQYGVAFTTEFVATPGRMCSGLASSQPCILGSGGGVVFPRIGWRGAGPWYVGFAAEFSKQDAYTLYQLPILQQYRGEARYYFLIGQVLTPFVAASGGIAGYGNLWTADTFGPDASLTVGVEAQVSRGTVVGLALNYRAIYFRSFVDSSMTSRESGVAQLIGLDIQLEVRDPYGAPAPPRGKR